MSRSQSSKGAITLLSIDMLDPSRPGQALTRGAHNGGLTSFSGAPGLGSEQYIRGDPVFCQSMDIPHQHPASHSISLPTTSNFTVRPHYIQAIKNPQSRQEIPVTIFLYSGHVFGLIRTVSSRDQVAFSALGQGVFAAPLINLDIESHQMLNRRFHYNYNQGHASIEMSQYCRILDTTDGNKG